MSDQASARVPAQLPGEAPRGIAADSAAVACQRAREGGHVVLEMLIAGHQPDQKIWSQLAAEPGGHIELVTVPIGGSCRSIQALHSRSGATLDAGSLRLITWPSPAYAFSIRGSGGGSSAKLNVTPFEPTVTGLPPLLKALPIAPSTAL